MEHEYSWYSYVLFSSVIRNNRQLETHAEIDRIKAAATQQCRQIEISKYQTIGGFEEEEDDDDEGFYGGPMYCM